MKMYMLRNYKINPVFRFRRWSRKGYAIFSSLGCCVTIGNLNKEVTDISLGKQQSLFRQPESKQVENSEIIIEGDAGSLPGLIWQQPEMLQLSIIIAEKEYRTSGPESFDVHNKYRENRMDTIKVSIRFFVFYFFIKRTEDAEQN